MCAARSQAEVEVAVIGAGVVGLAVAAVLSERRSVAVIERHDSYGRENSSHNSGVIHAGLYYPADWLKSALCVESTRLLSCKHPLTGLKRRSSWFEVRVEGPDAGEFTLTAASVVNAAGLAADSVGQSLGFDPDGGPGNPPFRQTVNRGWYYDVVNREKAARIAHLIYPLPHSDRSGLGIHVTVDVNGDVHLGPDNEWLAEGAKLDFRMKDDRRLAFLEAARRYWPALESEDLAPGQVGYRPKLSGPAGAPGAVLRLSVLPRRAH